MNRDFEALRNDFNSSQAPTPYDPMTIKTLCRIADSIFAGETTLQEFEEFLRGNRLGITPPEKVQPRPFGDECYSFVYSILEYFWAKTGK